MYFPKHWIQGIPCVLSRIMWNTLEKLNTPSQWLILRIQSLLNSEKAWAIHESCPMLQIRKQVVIEGHDAFGFEPKSFPTLYPCAHTLLPHRKLHYRMILCSISFIQAIFRQAGWTFFLSCCSSCFTVAMVTGTPSELCALSGVQRANTLVQFNPLTPLAPETVKVSKLDSLVKELQSLLLQSIDDLRAHA